FLSCLGNIGSGSRFGSMEAMRTL
nr:hypothetical protein [Tanacetum cinerariifolium]